MTVNPMHARMGLSLALGVTDHINQGTAAKLARSLQKYRNEMIKVTAAMNENVTLQNEVNTRDAAIRLQFDLEKRSQADQGTAAVAAAAAGVRGRSVDRTMRGLRRSALFANAARKERLRMEMASHANDRRNIRVGAIMGQDVTVHSKPSVMASMTKLGVNLLQDFDASQPEGDKIGDRLKRWWET